MIDTYRFILALCVVQGHLFAAGAPWLAWQAVFSFYVLSGFLMTLVLNERYRGRDGLISFAINRWLRIFPAYYVVIGLTALYIAFIGPLTELNSAMTIPSTPWAIFANMTIVPLRTFDMSQAVSERLSPATWSLAIELFCYALLAIYFARSAQRLLAMLTIGIGVATIQIVTDWGAEDYGFQNHYGVLQAGLIPFALGGLACHWRRAACFAYSDRKIAVFVIAFLANCLLGYLSDFHRYVGGLFAAALINAAAVPIMFWRPATMPWQKALGGMAYPLFLCHWLVGTLVIIYLPKLAPFGFVHFAAATAGSIALAMLIYRGVDQQIEGVRSMVKTIIRKPLSPGLTNST
jgi:peptidoglycan/LPS O-acetylase OafA/YrhL